MLLLVADRVMTCSFHKYGGGFFPGTGDVLNVGRGECCIAFFLSAKVPQQILSAAVQLNVTKCSLQDTIQLDL